MIPNLDDIYMMMSNWGVGALWLLSGAASIRFAAYWWGSRDWGALFMTLLSLAVFIQFTRIALGYIFNMDYLGYGSLYCVITTWLLVGIFGYIVWLQARNVWTKRR
jgi:hypothetical protein